MKQFPDINAKCEHWKGRKVKKNYIALYSKKTKKVCGRN